jgi:hypothetical protein
MLRDIEQALDDLRGSRERCRQRRRLHLVDRLREEGHPLACDLHDEHADAGRDMRGIVSPTRRRHAQPR